MQPQQPTPPPSHPANYDFIMNPAAPPRKTLFNGGSSLAVRLLVVVGGLFLLVILAVIFMQLLGKGGSSFNKAAVLSVAQDQTEIMRLAERGTQDSTAQTTKNFAMTASLSIKSDQAILLKHLADKGYKPGEKDLALKQSASTDSQLDDAKSSSTFDTAFTGVMKQALQTYEQDLSAAYDGAKSPETKAVLKARYNTATLLLTQLSTETN